MNYPYLGKIPILTNIFQRGWNHQLVKLLFHGPKWLSEIKKMKTWKLKNDESLLVKW